MHAREKSLKNFGLVPLRCRHVQRCRALAALSCRSCRRRGWSGWGGIERRDDIVDLGAAAGLKKRTSEARTGSEADQNPTPSAPMTHSQGSNSVARLRRSDHLSPKYGGDGKARQCNGTVTRASVATAAPPLRGERAQPSSAATPFEDRRQSLSIRFHERGALTA